MLHCHNFENKQALTAECALTLPGKHRAETTCLPPVTIAGWSPLPFASLFLFTVCLETKLPCYFVT